MEDPLSVNKQLDDDFDAIGSSEDGSAIGPDELFDEEQFIDATDAFDDELAFGGDQAFDHQDYLPQDYLPQDDLIEEENYQVESVAGRLTRSEVLIFNKSLSRARYNRVNLELIQNIEPIANVLNNDEIAGIIKSSLGNAFLIDPNKGPQDYSFNEKYASLLCSFNLGSSSSKPLLSFNPGFFPDISAYQKEAGDDMFDEFVLSLKGRWDESSAVESPHHMISPVEIMDVDLIVKTKKLLAYEILLDDNKERKKLKSDLQLKISEYEKSLLTLYNRLHEMRSTQKTDIESLKIELSIGYLLLALQEEGYEDVFKNKAKIQGLYINPDRLNQIRKNSKEGVLSTHRPLTSRLNYIPLESGFEATTVDPGDLFASTNKDNLESLIGELSESIQLDEIGEGCLE